MKHLNVVPLHEPDATVTSEVVGPDADIFELIVGGGPVGQVVPFSSDVWDLKGHSTWPTKAGGQTNLDFSEVPVQWRTASKEWALLCLNPQLALEWAPDDPVAQTWPENQEPVRPITLQSNLKQLRLTLQLMDRYDIYEPDSDGWVRVAALMRQPQDRNEKLTGTVLAPGTLRGRAQNIRTLWSIRTIVQRPTLMGAEPFDGDESTVVFGSGAAPKTNSRRPHEDVGRCLGFVAWVFDNLSDNILEQVRWWYDNRMPPGDKPLSKEEGREEMVALLYETLAERGELPGVQNQNGGTTLAHGAMAWLLGETDANVAFDWGRFALRQFDSSTLSLVGGNPCPVPITELPTVDGGGTVPWADRLLLTRTELKWWASALVYYGMFYIAATCGLRDLDLDYLPLDCLKHQTKTRPTGETYEVAEIHGYKQKNRHVPVKTSWVVNGRIAHILEVIKQLHDIYEIEPTKHPQTGEKRLFDSQLITASVRSTRDSLHMDLTFAQWLVKGSVHLRERDLIREDLSDVGRMNASTTRITALQAYAALPLGNALAAQFGQWSSQSVAMGYHMDVYKIIHLADPMDAAELQNEHIGRTLRNAAENIDDIRGNGRARLEQVIERNAKVLSNPAPLSASRLKRLGKDNPNIEVGPYTICVFNSDGALCGGRGAADFRLCQPFECRNSGMTPGQRARVELRRRLELAGSPVQQRSARKLAEGMPEIVEEFTSTTDTELVRLVAEELEDYIVEALGLDTEQTP